MTPTQSSLFDRLDSWFDDTFDANLAHSKIVHIPIEQLDVLFDYMTDFPDPSEPQAKHGLFRPYVHPIRREHHFFMDGCSMSARTCLSDTAERSLRTALLYTPKVALPASHLHWFGEFRPTQTHSHKRMTSHSARVGLALLASLRPFWELGVIDFVKGRENTLLDLTMLLDTPPMWPLPVDFRHKLAEAVAHVNPLPSPLHKRSPQRKPEKHNLETHYLTHFDEEIGYNVPVDRVMDDTYYRSFEWLHQCAIAVAPLLRGPSPDVAQITFETARQRVAFNDLLIGGILSSATISLPRNRNTVADPLFLVKMPDASRIDLYTLALLRANEEAFADFIGACRTALAVAMELNDDSSWSDAKTIIKEAFEGERRALEKTVSASSFLRAMQDGASTFGISALGSAAAYQLGGSLILGATAGATSAVGGVIAQYLKGRQDRRRNRLLLDIYGDLG